MLVANRRVDCFSMSVLQFARAVQDGVDVLLAERSTIAALSSTAASSNSWVVSKGFLPERKPPAF